MLTTHLREPSTICLHIQASLVGVTATDQSEYYIGFWSLSIKILSTYIIKVQTLLDNNENPLKRLFYLFAYSNIPCWCYCKVQTKRKYWLHTCISFSNVLFLVIFVVIQYHLLIFTNKFNPVNRFILAHCLYSESFSFIIRERSDCEKH